ncbi:MAG: 3D domain-containing protein [Eubacterium sp.]|nr:3D domain-containing protein [Eubacterium sp.]
MKTLKKVMLVTTVSIVSFAGLNLPTDTIIAESQRLYETTHSADIHSSAFQSLDSGETEVEKILNDNKSDDLVLETVENVPENEIPKKEEKVAVVTNAVAIDPSTGEPSSEEETTEEKPADVEPFVPASVYETTPAVEIDYSTSSKVKSRSYAGNFELTAYVATGCPCADGNYPQVGHTVACNDSSLWHKWIEIEGYGIYYVHDTGGMACNVIDVFVGSYDEAIQFGRRCANIYVLEY